MATISQVLDSCKFGNRSTLVLKWRRREEKVEIDCKRPILPTEKNRSADWNGRMTNRNKTVWSTNEFNFSAETNGRKKVLEWTKVLTPINSLIANIFNLFMLSAWNECRPDESLSQKLKLWLFHGNGNCSRITSCCFLVLHSILYGRVNNPKRSSFLRSGGENALHRFGCCYFSWVAYYRLVRNRQMIYYVRGWQQYVLHGNRVRYGVIIFSIHQSHTCDQTPTSTFSVESERKTKVTPIRSRISMVRNLPTCGCWWTAGKLVHFMRVTPLTKPEKKNMAKSVLCSVAEFGMDPLSHTEENSANVARVGKVSNENMRPVWISCGRCIPHGAPAMCKKAQVKA